MQARIFSPAKTAMQSGKGKTGLWILEYERQSARKIEPLMGYTSSSDMNSQIRLEFSSREEAEKYCKKNSLAYSVQKPHKPRRRQVTYAENFSYNRALPWTH
ncbi:MAG: ETC complex I subunit [Rhizobiaceae bacterium]|nr:ETC complex I subunit [Rhizobiaceae bacterium]